MKRILQCIAAVVVTLSVSPTTAQEHVLVIRHAEMETGISDPPLSDAGRNRAANWAETLGRIGIDIVINTDATRARETGEIIAGALGVDRAEVPMADVAALLDMLTFDHEDDTVLVVAHTETIPSILRNLGIREEVELRRDDHANLFIVRTDDAGAGTLLHLRMH